MTKKAGSEAFDVRKWAKESKVQNARRCMICTMPKQAIDAVNMIGEMRVKGETEVSQPMVAQMLLERFEIEVGVGSLQRHYRSCEMIHWGTATRLRK